MKVFVQKKLFTKIALWAILTSFFTQVCYGHSVQPKPLYHSDEVYRSLNKQIPVLGEGVLAKIGQEELSQSQFKEWLFNRVTDTNRVQMFINAQILIQEAKKRNLYPKSDQIQNVIERHFKRRVAVNGPFHKSGFIPEESLYLQVKQNVMRGLAAASLLSQTPPPERELKGFYREHYGLFGKKYRIQQIFIPHALETLQEGHEDYAVTLDTWQKKEIERMHNLHEVLLKDPGAFMRLAALNCSDFDLAYQNGYTGPFFEGEYGGEYERGVPLLKEGQISKPLISDRSIHIVKVEQVKDGVPYLREIKRLYRPYQLKSMKKDPGRSKIEALRKLIQNQPDGNELFQREAKETMKQVIKAFSIATPEGWVNYWDMVFRGQLEHLKKGEMSPVIESSAGFHLIKILEMKESDFENVKKDVLLDVCLNKVKIDYHKVLSKIASKSVVKVNHASYMKSSIKK